MAQSKNRLVQSRVVVTPVALATALRGHLKAYASDAAAFVHQIHYWATNGFGVVDTEGRRWVYNRYEDWLEQFKWLTEHGFRKIKSVLIGLGIIETSALNGCDRTLYYALNYQHEYLADFFNPHKTTDAAVTSTTVPSVDCLTDDKAKITPEINSEKTTAPAAVILKKEQPEEMPLVPVIEVLHEIFPSPKAKTEVSPANPSISSLESPSQEILRSVKKAGLQLNEQFQVFLLKQHLEDVVQAIAFYRKTVQEKGERKNPIGWLIGCIRGKWWITDLEQSPRVSGMPQAVDPPTIEQMVQLQSAVDRGEIHDIHLSSDGVTKVIKLDRLTQITWRDYLESSRL